MREHFKPLQVPKQSCDFNPVEKCWRAVKGRYRSQLTLMAAEKPIT